jgi:hypothetical protein
MIECIEFTSIPFCMVGLLTAFPGTQLTRRLAREGRLHRGHDTLFDTAARRDVYLDYLTILKNIYNPDAYFERVRRVGRLINRSDRPLRLSFRDLLRMRTTRAGCFASSAMGASGGMRLVEGGGPPLSLQYPWACPRCHSGGQPCGFQPSPYGGGPPAPPSAWAAAFCPPIVTPWRFQR